MSLTSKADLLRLAHVNMGMPSIPVIARGESSYDHINMGMPMYARGLGFDGSVNVSGTWKELEQGWINVSGTWKELNRLESNISGTWKE